MLSAKHFACAVNLQDRMMKLSRGDVEKMVKRVIDYGLKHRLCCGAVWGYPALGTAAAYPLYILSMLKMLRRKEEKIISMPIMKMVAAKMASFNVSVERLPMPLEIQIYRM